jgi:hypothetical protein
MASGPSAADPLGRLGQAAHIAEIDQIGHGEWVTLYEFTKTEHGDRYYYSALIETNSVTRLLRSTDGELKIGHGTPGFSQSTAKGVVTTTYNRLGHCEVEPLVHVRDFHGMKPGQIELSEEFRLYHNLYHDRSNDVWIRIDDAGNDTIVAKIDSDRVRVLNKYLRQYMAGRQMALVLYFDHRAHEQVAPESAKAALPSQDVALTDRRYRFHVGDGSGCVFSRLIGKKIIRPPPVSQSGVWPYDEDERNYAEFIIGVDDGGNEIVHTCEPDKLANYFGANPDAPHYLTPVWFRREVLRKYYDEGEKYSVEDGYLRCGSLWGLRIDNNSADGVMVYLGDLGESLALSVQVYWRSYNITPGDRTSSETNCQRAFAAQFANPTAPDLLFKQNYVRFQEVWKGHYGWQLFRTLHDDDGHVLRQLRVPLSESVGEFEIQTLYLAKLLIEALNDAEIVKACRSAEGNDVKSITKLERFLMEAEYTETARDCKFLRIIYKVRSTGSAHWKARISIN